MRFMKMASMVVGIVLVFTVAGCGISKEKYNALLDEKVALEEKANVLAKARDALKNEYDNLLEEKMDLATKVETIANEKNALKAEYDKLLDEKIALKAAYDKVIADSRR